MNKPDRLHKPAVRVVLLIAALCISVVLMMQGCKSKEIQARYGVQKTTF